MSTTTPFHRVTVHALFLLSGVASLVLQVVWMRELALLFGSTAQAAAATLAAFFLGLAAGGAWWGRRSARLRRPLRAYALLEVGVAAGAVLFLLLEAAFGATYGALYGALGSQPELFLALKLGLALVLLFPATFCMGGTLPVLVQHLVRDPAALGRGMPLLYGLNTLGAAAGVLLAAFVLPQHLGYATTYGAAIALAATTAAAAWALDAAARRGTGPETGATATPMPRHPQPASGPMAETPAAPGPGLVRGLAFLSGFVTLALEVLWTRMLAQVLQNSVYTYAAVLVVFLAALALASLGAGALARRRLPPRETLAVLLVAGGLLTATTPLVFHGVSGGMHYLGGGSDWAGYVLAVLGGVTLILLPAVLALGLVFPYLARVSEPRVRAPGATAGELVALNTLGAIAGSLAAGFLLLDWLGLWRSVQLLAALYLAAALLVAPPAVEGRARRAWVAAPLAGLLLIYSVLDSARLPVVRVDPLARQESLYEVWESGAGIVAVVRRGDDLRLKVDNHYTLGGTAGRAYEARQGHFPLLLHPEPRSVFFLGLGTGITAGAALAHPVERLVAAELIPDAITAARRYFAPWTNGLFEDPRVTLVAEDGRHHLAATPERYDVIVGDLFVPWRAGAGSLYTVEHFRNVRARLATGGVFAQWLPLYQLTDRELGTIARTFLEVFPDATLWRGDFLPDGPIVALVGARDPAPLDPGAVLQAEQALARAHAPDEALPDGVPGILLYYGGNLGQAAERFAGYPLNTDARPVIELEAPRAHRAQIAGTAEWVTGRRFLTLLEDLATAAPPERDPYLAELDAAQRRAVDAGSALFRARVHAAHGETLQAQAAELEAQRLLTRPDTRNGASPQTLRRQLDALRAEYSEALGGLEDRLEALGAGDAE